jgi:spore germination protein KB
MFLEKGKISNFQLGLLIIGFVFGSSVIISPGQGAGHDAWIAVALGLMESLLIVWIFTTLAKQFKGMTIVEINSLVYGKILGTCISVLFIWYVFHLGAMVLDNYASFFKLEIYANTPRIIIILALVLVCISTVGRGIEVLARCSVILVPITILIAIADSTLIIPQIDLKNLLPVLDVPISLILWAGHGAASFPFAETVAFLMVLAFVDKTENITINFFKSLLIVGTILIIVVARNFAVMGPMAGITNYPSYLLAQAINIGEVLTRLEVLIAVNLITMGFIKVSVLLYGTVLGFAQVLNLHSYRPIILPIGILMAILALTTFGNSVNMLNFAQKGYPVYAAFFQIGIPLITLVVAKLRKLNPAGGSKA